MFRADTVHLLQVPPMALGQDAKSLYYKLVEPVANLPTWLIHVLPDTVGPDGTIPWRRLMATSLPFALDVMSQSEWRQVRLYVLLPPNYLAEEGTATARCLAVWECREPHGEEVCWLVDTDSGAVMDSMFGTRPNEAKRVRLLWSDTKER